MIIPIEPGLELRSISMADALDMACEIDRNRDRLRQWLPWLDSSKTVQDVREFIAPKILEEDERISLTTCIWWNAQLVGSISLHRFDLVHRNSSVGYWLSEECAGKGMMTKACRAIVSAGFQEFGLHRIEIRCAKSNHRSAAVAQRLGFREEGTLREAEWLYDHWVDLRVFAMLEQDWKKWDGMEWDGKE